MSNTNEPNKIIFSMVKVSKFYDKKPVLKDIYLSFFYGAKIGVLGLNGAGKSSLLRIIAGTDKDFNGEVVFSQGYSVGLLEQEPKLDESKTVRQIVEEGVQSTVDLLKEFEEIKRITAAVPTIVTVYLDRPAILTELKNRAAALIGNFGVSDTALLDVVTGIAHPVGRLPFELPSSMEEVEAQSSSRPHDSRHPLYPIGAGLQVTR